MLIYLTGSLYASLYQNQGVDDDIILNKDQRYKATYEVKKENGFLRHYVTKTNGDKVMIRETKLPKSQEYGRAAEVKGQVTEMLFNPLVRPFHKEPFDHFSKTSIFAQQEQPHEKYKQSV